MDEIEETEREYRKEMRKVKMIVLLLIVFVAVFFPRDAHSQKKLFFEHWQVSALLGGPWGIGAVYENPNKDDSIKFVFAIFRPGSEKIVRYYYIEGKKIFTFVLKGGKYLPLPPIPIDEPGSWSEAPKMFL